MHDIHVYIYIYTIEYKIRATTPSGMNLFNLIRFERRNEEGSETRGGSLFKKDERGGSEKTLRGTDSLDSSAGVKSRRRRAASRARDTRGRDGKKKERKRQRRGRIGTARLVEARKESRAKSSLEMPRKQCRGWPEIYLIVESTAGVEGEEREKRREREKKRKKKGAGEEERERRKNENDTDFSRALLLPPPPPLSLPLATGPLLSPSVFNSPRCTRSTLVSPAMPPPSPSAPSSPQPPPPCRHTCFLSTAYFNPRAAPVGWGVGGVGGGGGGRRRRRRKGARRWWNGDVGG